jgi:hypothetical protein
MFFASYPLMAYTFWQLWQNQASLPRDTLADDAWWLPHQRHVNRWRNAGMLRNTVIVSLAACGGSACNARMAAITSRFTRSRCSCLPVEAGSSPSSLHHACSLVWACFVELIFFHLLFLLGLATRVQKKLAGKYEAEDLDSPETNSGTLYGGFPIHPWQRMFKRHPASERFLYNLQYRSNAWMNLWKNACTRTPNDRSGQKEREGLHGP